MSPRWLKEILAVISPCGALLTTTINMRVLFTSATNRRSRPPSPGEKKIPLEGTGSSSTCVPIGCPVKIGRRPLGHLLLYERHRH